MLTSAAVKKLKPHKVRREVPDGHGLYLKIEPTGHKSWVLHLRRPDGKHGKITLGTTDTTGTELEGEPAVGGHLTLAAARKLVAEIHRQRALGRDVVADRGAEKRQRALLGEHAERASFVSAARDFIEREARGRKKNRGWRNTAALLGLAYPLDAEKAGRLANSFAGEPTLIPGAIAERWRDRAVSSISSDDIFVVIDEARERGVPGRDPRNPHPSEARARELSCALSAMFRWLRGKRRVPSDPCAGVERPSGPRKRERVLNTNSNVRGADELRWFWSAANGVGDPFGALVKVLLLTGQRRTEVAQMERRELSDDFSTWTIPSARTKNKREHTVPLSPLVREILKGVLDDPLNHSSLYLHEQWYDASVRVQQDEAEARREDAGGVIQGGCRRRRSSLGHCTTSGAQA